MKHFILPEDFSGEELTIRKGKDFHYLSHVLRLREGDTLNCIDKTGKPYKLIILTVDERHIRLKPIEDNNSSPVSTPISNLSKLKPLNIDLYQCIPKGKKMDLIIRQATEMGVQSITPVISRYTIPVLKQGKNIDNKIKRWKRIAKEAAQQSGAPNIPEINNPVLLKNIRTITAQSNPEILIFFHTDSKQKTELHRILCRRINTAGLMIGPEGGFSEAEAILLKSYGFYSAYLGDTILRTETAAVYAVAAVKTIILEKNSWNIII